MLPDSHAPALAGAIGLFRLAHGILVLVARMRGPAVRIEQAENRLILLEAENRVPVGTRATRSGISETMRKMSEAFIFATLALVGARLTLLHFQ